ncbi:MAG: hypothetical protein KGJ44_10085 [Betaproteobacteria bacterium]|nr:hypothetical protein [Betaproteobacteria bacterium]
MTEQGTSLAPLDAARMNSLKTLGWISYGMHLVVAVGAVLPGVQASVLLLLVAFILDLVKKGDAVGTWHESHFDYRIRTVLWAAGLYIVTIPLWVFFIVPGWIAWTVISVWFLYRIVRGMLRLSEEKPMEPASL